MSFLFGDSDNKDDKAWAYFGSDNLNNDDKTSGQDCFFNFNSECGSCNNQDELIFKIPSSKTSISCQIQEKTQESHVKEGILQDPSKTPQTAPSNNPPESNVAPLNH